MLTIIPDLLDASLLAVITQTLRDAPFVDGKHSAGRDAGAVKRNQELDPQWPQTPYLQKLLVGVLYSHPLFRSAVLPQRISAPIFARYTAGMGYGEHIDDPVMGQTGERYRADVALTVFLNSTEDYSGGELCVRTSYGTQATRLPAGQAVLYPASSLHSVAAVTRGERLVAVAWVQSLVRDAQQRELLFTLEQAREALRRDSSSAQGVQMLQQVQANLVRMWSEV